MDDESGDDNRDDLTSEWGGEYDLRKYYFTNRVVNAWNSLHDHVVLSETINTCKSRLDKFWQHQDMIYDFQAELHGTGSRSLYRS